MDMREKLLKRRKQLLDEANGLLETCEQAKRGLTDNEKAKHDRLIAQVKEINATLEANAAAEREAAVTVPISQTTAMAVALGTMPAETPGGAGASTAAGGGFALGEYVAGQGRTTFSGGGALIPSDVLDVWPSLLPESVALAAGVTVMPCRDRTLIPYVSAHPTAAFIGDDDEIPATNTKFGGVEVFFKVLAARKVISNHLTRSAGPDATRVLLREPIQAVGLKVDHSIFEGTGVEHEVKGVKHWGILGAALGADGDTLDDLDPLIAALTALESANAKPSGWVLHPRTWGSLMRLRDQVDSLRPLLGESYGVSGTTGIARTLLGLPCHLSTQLSVTETEGSSGAVCSSIYCAEWRQVIVARDEAQAVYVDIDTGEKFSRDQSQIRVVVRMDVVVPNPSALYRVRGIKPTS